MKRQFAPNVMMVLNLIIMQVVFAMDLNKMIFVLKNVMMDMHQIIFKYVNKQV